jgi:hypothetical protein
MSVSMRRGSTPALVGLAALGTLLALGSPAQAQIRAGGRVINSVGIQGLNNAFRINPNPYLGNGLTLGQAAYNTGVVGSALSTIPPYLFGYNPYPPVNIGPSYPSITPYAGGGGYSSYAGNPYYAGASIGTSGGYGMSTVGGGGDSGYGTGAYPGYGSSLPPGYGDAAVINATGNYYKQIAQARMGREQARQMAIETRRRLIQEEAEYERMRPRAINVIMRDIQTDLNIARIAAPPASIWSGKALNDLMGSINRPGRKLKAGPTIRLDDEALKSINLANAAFKGQIALLRNGGKLTWPGSLQDTRFDDVRERFSSKFKFAVGQLKSREDAVDPAAVKDLRSYLKTLNNLLSSGHEDLSPSQYIEARKYLNQLAEAVKALDDPRVANYFNESWRATGSTVAELIKNMNDKGLKFAPATPGEEAPYDALYQALRVFENGVQVAATPPPPPPPERER